MSNSIEMESDAPAAVVAGLAEHRRSIRKYQDKQIPESDIRELLRLSGRAPSAFNSQPWRFVVVRDAELKARLAEAANNQRQVQSALTVIVMYSDMEDALARLPEAMHPALPAERREADVAKFRAGWSARSSEEREAWASAQSYIALGYLLLIAESMGFGTSPMLGFSPDKVKALLALPANARVTALVALGYPDETGFEPHRLPSESLISIR